MIKPRQEIFDTYWEFAAERQRVFYRRLHGYPSPWTEDKILLAYRFCNAFRAADRVSQYLIRHVIYGDHLSRDPREVVFRLLLFRFFNMSETWDLLEKEFGTPSLENFDVDTWYKAMDTGQGLFNGAYMLCGVKVYGFDRKHGNYLALVNHMVEDGLLDQIINAPSFEAIYKLLTPYKLVGKFLAYQIATDIVYSDAVDFEENDFTMAGPGAERGITKCFESTGGHNPEYMIRWMRDRQEEEFTKRDISLEVAHLWGRSLQSIDIQNLFCETDKYCRVAFPDLDGGGGKMKIKSGFRVTPGPAIVPFFPPKWGLNDKLSQLPEVTSVANPDDDLPWSMDW